MNPSSYSPSIVFTSTAPYAYTLHNGASEDAALLREEFSRIQFKRSSLESSTYGKILSEINFAFFEACEEDWDGYDALPLDYASWKQAQIFAWLLPTEVNTPDVEIDNDGEVSFDWYEGPRRNISVSISGRGELTYAYIIGAGKGYGVEILDYEIPEAILALIERIYRT